MASNEPQSFKNHARLDPPYHFFLLLVALVTFLWAAYQLTQRQGFADIWFLVLSVAFIVMALKLRSYPLKVQDRVIRLEERLRLAALLPESLKPRIGELTESQLIALRFASDGELAGLVQKTLDKKLSSKEIKKAIVNWRPDYFRI